jgi:hypothetical protein
VIFVHGCFWHGHECRRDKLPKTRTKYWAKKIQKKYKKRCRRSEKVEKARLGIDYDLGMPVQGRKDIGKAKKFSVEVTGWRVYM